MLQTGKIRSNNDDQPAVANEPGLEEVVVSVFGLVWRQYLIILVITLLTTGIGLIYSLTTPPRYTAQARIITDTRKEQASQQSSLFSDAPIDLESQVQILKSEDIISSVIKKLHLTEDTEFVGPDPGFTSIIFGPFFQIFRTNQPKSEFEVLQEAIGAFEKQLDAKRVGMSYVIEITFQSRNADRAAQIANAVADAYIWDQQEAKFQATRRASEWMKDRMQGLREQALAADRAVAAFKIENNIIAAGGRLMDEQQIAELNSQLVAAHSRTSEALARLDRIQIVIREDRPDAPVDATVSDALTSPIVTKLRDQFLELSNREAEWAARYGKNHLAVIHLRDQKREIRDSMFAELQRLAETYKSNYEIAKQHQDEIEKELAKVVLQTQTTNKTQGTLRELEGTAQSYHSLYDNSLRQLTESAERQSFPVTEARVISRANTPTTKSNPKTLLVLAVSVLGGVSLGVGLGWLREAMDRVFRTSSQVEPLLKTPCTALVPLLSDKSSIDQRPRHPKGETRRQALATPAGGPFGPRTIVRNSSMFWTLVNTPMSQFAEAIRSIKVAADSAELNGANRSNRVIGFTSSLPNEGKSTLAAALAQLVAQVKGSVIVVDCDLRNPSLSRALAPDSEVGIVEVISGQRSLEEVIWKEPKTNMAFLPVGNSIHLYHTSEILASVWTKELFNKLRMQYDYVIVDLPPLTPIVDVRATVHFVDQYFMVIEWGRTKIDVVQHALREAGGVYDSLVGVILNKTDMKSLRHYEWHREKYYYNEHFTRYGSREGARSRAFKA